MWFWSRYCIFNSEWMDYITEKLLPTEQSNLTFIQADFTTMCLPPCNLLLANYSIHFCTPDKFDLFWENIQKSIFPQGYFVGTFLGIHDEWNTPNSNKIFFERFCWMEIENKYKIIF